MCTKSIAFAKALAHTCEQISRVLCGEIKNFKPNKNKNVSNEKQALSQGLLFLCGYIIIVIYQNTFFYSPDFGDTIVRPCPQLTTPIHPPHTAYLLAYVLTPSVSVPKVRFCWSLWAHSVYRPHGVGSVGVVSLG